MTLSIYGNLNVTKLSKFKLKCANLYRYWINTNSRVQKVKAANSRVQKYKLAYGRVQKVKAANSRVQKFKASNSRVQNLQMSALTHLGKSTKFKVPCCSEYGYIKYLWQLIN